MAIRADRLATLVGPWLGSGPAYVGLAAGVRALALDGRLAVDARVPSERELALALALSRTTVSAAYNILRTEGYLRSDRGAGSSVSLPIASPVRPDAEPGEPRGDVLDLTVAALPAPAILVDAVAEAAGALHRHLAGHGLHPMGVPELRLAVARHLTGRGLTTEPEQVLVTNGALHGLDLLLRAFARPGDRVAVEQPTYPSVLDAVAAHRLRTVALPVHAQGWELPSPRARLLHVTPDGQNPTGLLADRGQREALLDGVTAELVVVDETFADLVLEGLPPPPLAAMEPRVITLGSMSKAFWAGLRIGWIRAEPAVLARLAQARAGQDLASPVLEQLVAARLLAAAGTVLPARRALLRVSRDSLLGALDASPVPWRCHRPAAGMVLWLELPGESATRVAAHALDAGLRVTAGPRFTVHGTADRWIRLPFTGPPERCRDVVRLLEVAVDRAGRGPAPVRAPSSWTA